MRFSQPGRVCCCGERFLAKVSQQFSISLERCPDLFFLTGIMTTPSARLSVNLQRRFRRFEFSVDFFDALWPRDRPPQCFSGAFSLVCPRGACPRSMKRCAFERSRCVNARAGASLPQAAQISGSLLGNHTSVPIGAPLRLTCNLVKSRPSQPVLRSPRLPINWVFRLTDFRSIWRSCCGRVGVTGRPGGRIIKQVRLDQVGHLGGPGSRYRQCGSVTATVSIFLIMGYALIQQRVSVLRALM